MSRSSNHKFVHIGADHVILEKSLIGIFDLDSITLKKDSRTFINLAQKNGEIRDITTDLPVTVVLCDGQEKKQEVYLSSFSLPTLYGRIRRPFPNN